MGLVGGLLGPSGGQWRRRWFGRGLVVVAVQAGAGVDDPLAFAAEGFGGAGGQAADAAAPGERAAAGHEGDPAVHVEIEAFQDFLKVLGNRAAFVLADHSAGVIDQFQVIVAGDGEGFALGAGFGELSDPQAGLRSAGADRFGLHFFIGAERQCFK